MLLKDVIKLWRSASEVKCISARVSGGCLFILDLPVNFRVPAGGPAKFTVDHFATVPGFQDVYMVSSFWQAHVYSGCNYHPCAWLRTHAGLSWVYACMGASPCAIQPISCSIRKLQHAYTRMEYAGSCPLSQPSVSQQPWRRHAEKHVFAPCRILVGVR